MAKERSVNPAAAQRKADKQKEIAKSKRNLQQQRNEKLSRRNPERVQKQIDEFRALERTSTLRPKDQETLTNLERDLKSILRAREALGQPPPRPPPPAPSSHSTSHPPRHSRPPHSSSLGKRRHSPTPSDATDPEAESIPIPLDTPPSSPPPHALPSRPPFSKPLAAQTPHQTVYSSAPQLRDLKKEAARFVPSVVAQQKRRVKGDGRLLEPEEIDALEQAGYYAAEKAAEKAGEEAEKKMVDARVRAVAREGGGDQGLEEEFRRFEREVDGIYPEAEAKEGRRARVEEVEDAGD